MMPLMTGLALRTFIACAFLFATPALAGKFSGRATVIDGDTIAVEGIEHRVRLWGVDAPEGRQICRDGQGADYRCGLRASDALRALIGDNGRVSCRIKDRDRYRRYVAICRYKGRSINRAVVLNGWALDHSQYSRRAYARDERAARCTMAGIWAGSFEPPWEWRKARRGEGRRG